MATNHKATIEAVNAAFSENRLEDFLALCTDDIEMGTLGEKFSVGKDPLRRDMTNHSWNAPVIHVTGILVDGDRGACHGTMEMDEKNGTGHRYAYADFYTFRGDKISRIEVIIHELKNSGQQG